MCKRLFILLIIISFLSGCSVLMPKKGLYRGIDGTRIFTSSLNLSKNGTYQYSSDGGSEEGCYRISRDSLFLSLSAEDADVKSLHAVYIFRGRLIWAGFYMYKKQSTLLKAFSKIVPPLAYPHNIPGKINRRFKKVTPYHK